jgi:Uma2 family endonuclease
VSAPVAAPARMNVAEFLDWAARQPRGRFELVDGTPIAMSPERNSHILAKGAVYRALREAVIRSRLDCVVLPDGATVIIDGHKSREPDVVVQCGKRPDPESTVVDAPTILVEVTSPSTMRTDTDDKLVEYFSLPTVAHYVLVHLAQGVVVHHRRTEGGSIETRIVRDGSLDLDPPGLSVPVAALLESDA